jgi:hypothetical protein
MTAEDPLPLLGDSSDPQHDERFRKLWTSTLAWVDPYYDSHHLAETVIWLVRLEPEAPEPLLLAALTHDIERHFPGGTQPNKAAGTWDDIEYNTRHTRRSAEIVGNWLRTQEVPQEFIDQVVPPILEHEFGGSRQGDLIQAADSLSFLDVNATLTAGWVIRGETTIEHARRKLDWMYERIRLEGARPLATPVYERALRTLEQEVERAAA